jgi:hypothetical protein
MSALRERYLDYNHGFPPLERIVEEVPEGLEVSGRYSAQELQDDKVADPSNLLVGTAWKTQFSSTSTQDRYASAFFGKEKSVHVQFFIVRTSTGLSFFDANNRWQNTWIKITH